MHFPLFIVSTIGAIFLQVKEIKFRPGTEEADYQVKLKNLIKFLQGGDKAKITMRFRGREAAHQVIGREFLERVEKKIYLSMI